MKTFVTTLGGCFCFVFQISAGSADEWTTVAPRQEIRPSFQHAPYFPVETALLKLMESPLDPQQLEAIMQGNTRRLLSRA